MNETKCELAYQLAYDPIYRASQLYTFLISILAVPSLFRFLVKRLFSLHFHGNLKTLLIAYFISLLLYATILCFDFGYHFLVPCFVTEKCNLIIDRMLFRIVHIPTLFLLTLPMWFPLGFIIERFMAMGMPSRYERAPTIMGPVLVFLLVTPNFFIFYFIFQNETFDDVFISFHMLPITSAGKFSNYLWFLLYLKCGNFIGNFAFLLVHKWFKKRYLLQKSTLSVRYAMEEISQSSKFTLLITSTHLIFFGIYTACSLFVRVLGQTYFGSFISHYIARGFNCATPTYNFVIVIVASKYLEYLNTRRAERILSSVQIKSTGAEGYKNYEDAMVNQWATIASSRN
ncbi:unnamed protein product [Caenorhabditis brenneri]